MKMDIVVTVNRRKYEARVEPRLLLSDFLRDSLGLTGTHVGCEHGVCGACTILVNGDSIRSCLTLAVRAEEGRGLRVGHVDEQLRRGLCGLAEGRCAKDGCGRDDRCGGMSDKRIHRLRSLRWWLSAALSVIP